MRSVTSFSPRKEKAYSACSESKMFACAVTKCYYTFREGFCHFYEVKVTVFNNIRLVLPGYKSILKASRIHPPNSDTCTQKRDQQKCCRGKGGGGGGGIREREAGMERDRQTDRQTQRQTD